MKPQVTVFIATSVDGYIARENGDLDWLDAANRLVPDGEDCGYGDLMQSIDALVMGRTTFEKVLSFGEWPYGSTPVIVLSSKPLTIPERLPETVTHSSETPQALCERLSSEGIRHLYIDGGQTIQRFLLDDLVDELIVTLIPVLLGSGIPLFGSLAADVHLSAVETKHYDFGFVQLHYRFSTGE